eukprot:2740519-Amphidinium_carterae.1
MKTNPLGSALELPSYRYSPEELTCLTTCLFVQDIQPTILRWRCAVRLQQPLTGHEIVATCASVSE